MQVTKNIKNAVLVIANNEYTLRKVLIGSLSNTDKVLRCEEATADELMQPLAA